jgi:N utilization substance protein A
VVNELRGEKIDVIRWSPDPATYIANSLSPARVDEVRLVNSEDRQVHVLVAEDQLSLAIGKEGQNVRLAARLTGWKIDIKDIDKYDAAAEDAKIEAEMSRRGPRVIDAEDDFEAEDDFDLEAEESESANTLEENQELGQSDFAPEDEMDIPNTEETSGEADSDFEEE